LLRFKLFLHQNFTILLVHVRGTPIYKWVSVWR
jgi:hypothetical protein